MDRSTIVTAGIAWVLLVVIANSYLRYRRRYDWREDPESLAVRFQRGETPGNETTNNESGVIEEGRFTDKLR